MATGAAINVGEVYVQLVRDLREGTCTTPGFEHALHNARLVEAVRRAGERGERQQVLIRTSVAIVLTIGLASQSQYFSTFAQSAQRVRTAGVAVGPQYDTTHVYVPLGDFDRFVASIIQTFGGKTSQDGVLTVTPTPSSTRIQLVLTPVGTLSVFGFKTPIPYPFGLERTGYLVTDMDEAIRAAKGTGADVLVAAFSDPIGQDAIIQWPGGVNTQLYWHTTAPSYTPLQTIPENRVYVSSDRADAFVRSFLTFSHGS